MIREAENGTTLVSPFHCLRWRVAFVSLIIRKRIDRTVTWATLINTQGRAGFPPGRSVSPTRARENGRLAEGRPMASNVLDHLADHVHAALKAAFSGVVRANPHQTFYTFALFTDDSLQFMHPAANTEEALTATVQRYRKEVDPKYGTTSTRTGMRWSHGDWGFFANFGEEHFEEINEALIANIDGPEEEFEARIDSLWAAALGGFQRLEKEGFFGSGSARSKITLLLVGDLPSEPVEEWVAALNPPDVAERYIQWNADAPDEATGND
jgi:hypothetical protein